MNELVEHSMSLQHRLDVLRAEHQVLDHTIKDMHLQQDNDELVLRRLKKRKLIIKDRIALIERMIEPDTLA